MVLQGKYTRLFFGWVQWLSGDWLGQELVDHRGISVSNCTFSSDWMVRFCSLNYCQQRYSRSKGTTMGGLYYTSVFDCVAAAGLQSSVSGVMYSHNRSHVNMSWQQEYLCQPSGVSPLVIVTSRPCSSFFVGLPKLPFSITEWLKRVNTSALMVVSFSILRVFKW